MATDTIVGNRTFPIYSPDGSSFHGLELKKSVYESVVMSLGDKVTGDVYYPTNALTVTMKEYIIYNGIKFVLVNPPVVVREGLVSDNGELKGMTKYSFTFYHPMYMLGNFPFSDVAVSSDQKRYLSENKTFFWIGNLTDYVAKLNKNLENTEWHCAINDSVSQEDRTRLSDVMSFDKNTIADALKTGYETWDIPYIITAIPSTSALYTQGKRFIIQFGLPTTEILVENEQHKLVPFVFHFGQGVGLKNNSRNPRNNKIVTRIAGFGSEDNIQYGYPQIPYTGGTCQYPLYYGIVGGQRVQLIKHPFTRTHLMPSIYRETVNRKVNPMASGYDPDIELKDYYDADNTYENPIKPLEPSYEIHEFEDIKPELGHRTITGVHAYETKDLSATLLSSFLEILRGYYTESEYLREKEELEKIINTITTLSSNSGSVNTRAYYCDWSFTKDERYAYVKYESSALNFNYTVLMVSPSQEIAWDDTMDDDGNYVQSYFRITVPQLSFDLYASAAITQEMTINMRSGACLGCSFPVMVDWDDYKLNFYDSDGNFAPNGSQRDFTKYPDSSQGEISLILQKETSTFGTLMPNIYQKPKAGDEFVILGISLPTTYITEAEARLDAEMKQYMRDNNVYYFDYPLKFDEYFLTTHVGILSQMDNNVVVRFDYAGSEYHLYIKQISIKYDNKPLPTYDITLTDNIEVVLNQIGQVVDEVRRLHDTMGGISIEGNDNYIRKDIDDTAYGTVSFIKGLQVGNRFVTGLLGEGGVFRKDEDGTTYLECDKLYVRMRAYFDTVEVRHYLHSAGNRIASMAGINCSRVEYIKANGDVTQDASEAVLFRCYFRANDDGREVRNDFVVGDLAFCKETNVNTDSIEQHGYWRAVVGRNANGTLTDDGEGWIDLSASDCQQGSGIPIAQDDIIQLGNKTDVTRQGAIVEFVSGEDAPSYQIFQGINDYNLNNKNYIGLGYSSSTGRAYMNVFGDAFIGEEPDSQGNSRTYIHYYQKEETDPETGQTVVTPTMDIKANVIFQSPDTGEDTSLVEYVNEILSEFQDQIDGVIDTYYMEGTPTMNNKPVTDWIAGVTDEEEKKAIYKQHIGDIYYQMDTDQGYRFLRDDQGVFSWVEITDEAQLAALRMAKEAVDLADSKMRVFVTQPVPPYGLGDLWVNAKYPATVQEGEELLYDDVILRCETAKDEDGTFDINDWTPAYGYSELYNFIKGQYADDMQKIESQLDKKAETWYQDTDPSPAWQTQQEDTRSEHIGDIWYDTSADGGNKTKVYQYDSSRNRYYWQETSVPDDVFDKIDGKAEIYVAKPTTYSERDLWVIGDDVSANDMPTGCQKGDIVIASNMPAGVTERTSYVKGDWVKKDRYTDDSTFNTFLNGTYKDFVDDIQSQIDGKAETWYQATDPSVNWNTSDLKQQHKGDIWHNSSSTTINGVGAGLDAIWNGTSWVVSDVPQGVYDKIDGKASIYTSKPSSYEKDDLWILEKQYTLYGGVKYPQGELVTATASSSTFNASHWTKKVKYTDDSALNEFKLNQYVAQLLNGTISTNITNAQSSAEAYADSQVATLDYVKTALKQHTDVVGGLVLSTLIALRDGNNRTWSGINGAYKASETGTGYKGHGIAAWFGGAMVDKEVATTATDYAKSLFRFDGSGYVAGGNLKWDKNGNVTIQGYDIKVNGESVAVGDLDDYVTIATDQTITGHKTFGTGNGSYIQIGAIRLVYDQSNNALKVVASDGSSVANFYATGGVSALGIGSGGSSGISIEAVWTALANTDSSKQINISHLTNALSGYNPTNNFKTINGESIIGTGNIEVQGGSGGSADELTNKAVTTSTINGLSGSFTFQGDNLINSSTDYVGMQIGSAYDKIQIAGQAGSLMIRQNDSGGTNSSGWTDWTMMLTASNYADYITGFVTLDTAQTISGIKTFSNTVHLNAISEPSAGNGLLVYKPASGWGGISSTQWGVGSTDSQGVIRSSNTNLIHYKGGTSYTIWDASNDGSGSGLDADLLDGHDTDYFLSKTEATSTYLTKTDANTTYLSIAFFSSLFRAYNSSNAEVVPNGGNTATIDNIKAMFGFWTEKYISALGKGSSGSSGISIETVWTALANSDSSKQISISHLTNALSGYNPTSNFKTINGESIIGTGDIAISAGTGTVTSIVTGGTTYSPTNGVVTLPDNIVYHKEDAYLNASFLKAEYSQKAAQKYIEFWDSTGGWFNFRLGTLYATSDVKVGSNSVIHAGNIGSQSVSYANSASTLANKTVTTSTIDGLAGSFTFEGNNLINNQYDWVGLQIGSSVDKAQILFDNGTIRVRQNDSGGTNASDWTAWTMLPTKVFTKHQLTKTDQWYRVANLTTCGLSYIISIRENFYNREPSPATFIINTSYTNATITQIGRATRVPNSITKLRVVKYGNGTFHVEVYTPKLSGSSSASMNTPEVNIFNLGRENTSDGIALVHDPNDDTKWLEVDKNIASGETLIEEADISTYTMIAGDMLLNNAQYIGWKNKAGTAQRMCIGLNSSNDFIVGYTTAGSGYNTYLDGNSVSIRYGTSRSTGIYLNSSGNVGIGTTSPSYKLHVGGTGYYSGNLLVQSIDIGNTNEINATGSKKLWLQYRNSGALVLCHNGANCGVGVDNPAYKLDVNGDVQATNFRGNFVGNADSATKLKAARTIWGQSFDGTANVSGAITNATTITASSNVSVGGTLSVTGTSTLTGHVGIGTSPHDKYVLRANGEVYVSTGLTSHGYVTALSDIRHKDVMGDVKLTVSEVANAPAVKFLWKDRRKEGMQVGSIAQYWQKVLPEAIVEGADGELTMSYGVIGLLASIATARKVEDHERRIAELEKENKELREQLKAA